MKIVFDQVEEAVLSRFQGGEGALIAHIQNDGLNKILHGTLHPGSTVGLHTHVTNSEIIYIISGQGKVLYDGAYETVAAGDCHYCPKGHSHSLINDSDGDLVFFAVVPEHGNADVPA